MSRLNLIPVNEKIASAEATIQVLCSAMSKMSPADVQVMIPQFKRVAADLDAFRIERQALIDAFYGVENYGEQA